MDVNDQTARRQLDGNARLLFASWGQAGLASAEGSGKAYLFDNHWAMKGALVNASRLDLRLDAASFEISWAMCQGTTGCQVCLSVVPAIQGRLEKLGNRRFAAALAVEELPVLDAGDSGGPPFS